MEELLNAMVQVAGFPLATLGSPCGLIRLIRHLLRRRESGHGTADNQIYRIAIYYTFLWLLGPMSHRFLDCLLSWTLTSCRLTHCIITPLIHSPAWSPMRPACSPATECLYARPSKWAIGNIVLEALPRRTH